MLKKSPLKTIKTVFFQKYNDLLLNSNLMYSLDQINDDMSMYTQHLQLSVE